MVVARKSKKMFQNMKMCITEENLPLKTEKYFSRKMLIFPDSPDIQSKLPDNFLIVQQKRVHFQIS